MFVNKPYSARFGLEPDAFDDRTHESVVGPAGFAALLHNDTASVAELRDRSGQLRDLMVLAHHVGQTWSGMDTVGIADELSAR